MNCDANLAKERNVSKVLGDRSSQVKLYVSRNVFLLSLATSLLEQDRTHRLDISD